MKKGNIVEFRDYQRLRTERERSNSTVSKELQKAIKSLIKRLQYGPKR